MAYDLMIKNGRIIDGSGMPAFRGDIAVRHGKIVAIGKLRDAASRTIDADGLVVAPGFIDNHCHYDVTGCKFSGAQMLRALAQIAGYSIGRE